MALRNLVPPKIASASAIGQAQTAQRMVRVVDFYKALPKGSVSRPKSYSVNPFTAYKQRYFGQEKASAAPFVHAIIGLFLFGYIQDYNNHLKHHKNNVH